MTTEARGPNLGDVLMQSADLAESAPVGLPPGFASAYADALRTHMAAPGEATHRRAADLGGWVLEEGGRVTDLAHLHQAVLGRLIHAAGSGEWSVWLARASGFLADALTPFEIALTAARQANDELVSMNFALAEAHTAVTAANDRLQAESLERRRAEEALWQAQKHQAVGRLAGGVAHHFNNLLTVIIGNLELARRGHGDEAALTQKLDRASEAARRAVKLTRQLLTFSGRQLLRPDAFEPSARLPDLIALLGDSLRGEIVVETEIPVALWPVRVDANELELALLNLAINAGDAMGGVGRLRIAAANHSLDDARLGLKGDYLMIEVADNGPGIDPAVLPRVFEPFFTTKEVGVGTGLGLSQVLGFAHQSKGAVDIDSRLGEGTVIRLYLPALSEAEAEAEPARAGVVLIVEDDVDVAEIAASMLDSHGFEVKLAYRGQMVLDLLQRGETVDLVFCDMAVSGGMSGLDLARALAEVQPGLPVLLAAGAPEALDQARREGVPVVAKPYRSGELYAQISALIKGRA